MQYRQADINLARLHFQQLTRLLSDAIKSFQDDLLTNCGDIAPAIFKRPSFLKLLELTNKFEMTFLTD